jgi:hypothetical protein
MTVPYCNRTRSVPPLYSALYSGRIHEQRFGLFELNFELDFTRNLQTALMRRHVEDGCVQASQRRIILKQLITKQTVLIGTDSAGSERPLAASRERCIQPFGSTKFQ